MPQTGKIFSILCAVAVAVSGRWKAFSRAISTYVLCVVTCLVEMARMAGSQSVLHHLPSLPMFDFVHHSMSSLICLSTSPAQLLFLSQSLSKPLLKATCPACPSCQNLFALTKRTVVSSPAMVVNLWEDTRRQI